MADAYALNNKMQQNPKIGTCSRSSNLLAGPSGADDA